MTSPLPTYANALLAPTVTAEEADLLARVPTLILAGWPDDAPQRAIIKAEAQVLTLEMIQRAALAYAASPAQVRQLRSFLTAQGYTPEQSADIASAWVDVTLTVYQVPRLPATKAVWSIRMVSTAGPMTIDASSIIVLQALDGTFFEAAQTGSAVVLNSGNFFTGDVTFVARNAGTTGNVPPGTIALVNMGPPGLRPDLVSLTNVSALQKNVTPARDEESDDDALTRATARWGTLAGILTADGWRYVMQTPDVGGVATLTRVFVDDTNPYGPNSVGITVANSTGAPTASELTAAQAQGVRYTIAGGGKVVVSGATTLTVTIAATIKTDGSNPIASAQARSALTQYQAGDLLAVAKVIEILMDISGVTNVLSLSLAADVQRPSTGVIVIDVAANGITVT